MAVIGISVLVTRLLTKGKAVSRFKKSLITLLTSVFLVSTVSLGYLLPYQKAEDVSEYLKSDEQITFVEEEKGDSAYYAFINNEGSNKVLVFYPGAKVDEYAYAELMRNIAESGTDVYVIKMPFHMAMLNGDGAKDIIDHNEYEKVYLAGHSLGGVAASGYTISSSDKVDGLILLASYSTRKIPDNVELLSIYGDKDGCLEMNVYEKNRSNWPPVSNEVVIKGGNHANYASYGKQKGDNEASITRDEQISITAEAIIEFMK